MSTLLLVKLKTVKDLLAAETLDSKADDSINTLISLISRKAERKMDRDLLAGAKTEVLDVEEGQQLFVLNAPPIDITQTITVKNATDQDWANADAIDSDFITAYDDDTGRLYIRVALWPGPRALQISYTGGVAADTDAFLTARRELSEALALEVAHHWKRLRNLGVFKESTGADAVEYPQLKFLPGTCETLAGHTVVKL